MESNITSVDFKMFLEHFDWFRDVTDCGLWIRTRDRRLTCILQLQKQCLSIWNCYSKENVDSRDPTMP